MFENGKFPTIEELLERGEHLIQKAVDGKRLSGEDAFSRIAKYMACAKEG